MLWLADVAAEQWGLFTTSQARNAGATYSTLTRLEAAGAIQRVRHGVYRLTGAPPGPLDDLRAAWLAVTPDPDANNDPPAAVVSHQSAADLHDLGTVEADRVEFTVPTRKHTRDGGIRFHVRRLTSNQWTLVDGLPTTTVAVTVADLAATGLDGGHLAQIVRDAIVKHGMDTDDVAAILRPYAHKYGATLGDGQGLVDDFLTQAGIPESLSRAAIARALPALSPGTSDIIRSMGLDKLSPDVTRSLRPLITQVLNGPVTGTLSEQLRAALIGLSGSAGGIERLDPSLTEAIRNLLPPAGLDALMVRPMGEVAHAATGNTNENVPTAPVPARELLPAPTPAEDTA